jgi:hypothetical protein
MMKSKALTVSQALLAGSLLLAACQRSESPAPSAPSDPESPAPVSSENAPRMSAGPGRAPTDQELARDLPFLKTSPPIALANGPAPLAKAAAVLPTCRVTFNNSASLANIDNQAYMGFAIRSYYQQPCNTSYTVVSAPVTGAAYRLWPEKSGWCPGTAPKIGTYNASGDCLNQTEGKNWARRLGNDANSDGVSFNVHNSIHYKDFDLKTLYVHSGTVVVRGYFPNGTSWYWENLTAGNTYFWPAGTTVSQLQIFEFGGDARYLVDNLEIAIHP